MLYNLKLKLSDCGKNRIPLAFISVVKNLNGSLLAQFIDPFAEILER